MSKPTDDNKPYNGLNYTDSITDKDNIDDISIFIELTNSDKETITQPSLTNENINYTPNNQPEEEPFYILQDNDEETILTNPEEANGLSTQNQLSEEGEIVNKFNNDYTSENTPTTNKELDTIEEIDNFSNTNTSSIIATELIKLNGHNQMFENNTSQIFYSENKAESNTNNLEEAINLEEASNLDGINTDKLVNDLIDKPRKKQNKSKQKTKRLKEQSLKRSIRKVKLDNLLEHIPISAFIVIFITIIISIILIVINVVKTNSYNAEQKTNVDFSKIEEFKNTLSTENYSNYYDVIAKHSDADITESLDISNVVVETGRKYPFNSILNKTADNLPTVALKFVHSELLPAIKGYKKEFGEYPFIEENSQDNLENVINLELLSNTINLKDQRLKTLKYCFDEKTEKITIYKNDKETMDIKLFNITKLKIKEITKNTCSLTYEDESTTLILNVNEEFSNIRLDKIGSTGSSVLISDTLTGKTVKLNK